MVLKFKKPNAPKADVDSQVLSNGVVVAEKSHTETFNAPESVVSASPTTEPLCEVGVNAGFTKNLGNYQSARVDVSLKIQCRHEEIDAVFDYGRQWVEGRLEELIKDDEEQA